MVANLPPQPSAQLQPVLDWLVGCEQLSADRIGRALSDVGYWHAILPASLGIPPATSKQAWLDWFGGGLAAKLFDPGMVALTLEEVFEAPGQITIHYSSKGTTKRGETYANEYLAVFQVRQDTPGGEFVIWRVKEFMDSAAAAKFAAQIAE